MSSGIEVLEFKKMEKGSLKGFAKILIPQWGLIIDGITLWENERGSWINMPSREYENDAKEKKYAKLVSFSTPELNKRFLDAVKKAIQKYLVDGAVA